MPYKMDSIKKLIFFFAGILLLVTVGCNSVANSLLDKAETLMQEKPKDALGLLDSLKQHPLKGKAVNARFALLYSMALDKSYIDVTDDSLISVAEDWYLKHGTAKEKFLVHYYKGVVNKNAKNFPESITAFSQAEKLRNKISDNYLLGLLYNQMGIIYNRHYEYNKSLNAFTQAHHLYELAEKSNHMNYMLMYIASCYWNMGDYANSEEYYKQAIRVGEQTNYKALVNLSVINLIGQYVEQERFSDALALNEKYKIGITPKRVKYAGNIARLMYMTGNGQKGADLMTQAWRFATSKEDLKWMERIINCTKENLLDKTYANYPTLNDDEKKLLCYIYAGFSPKAISVFLNIPIETVYNRKSRLLAKTGLSKTKNTTI